MTRPDENRQAGIGWFAVNSVSGALALATLTGLPSALFLISGAFGVLGFLLALTGLSDAGHLYENFLLIITYWIGPWLAVYLTDWFLRRGKRVDGFLYDKAHNPWGGVVSMAIGMIVSIWLFSNQSEYVGLVPNRVPSFGDSTFEVGFVVAAVLYAVLFRFQRDKDVEEAAVVA